MVRWYPALLPPPPPPPNCLHFNSFARLHSLQFGALWKPVRRAAVPVAPGRRKPSRPRRHPAWAHLAHARTAGSRLRILTESSWDPVDQLYESSSKLNRLLIVPEQGSETRNRGKVMFTRSSFFSPWNDLYVLNYQFYHFQIDFLELVLDHFLLLVSLTGNSIVGVEIETSAWPLGMAKVMWTKKYWNA